MCKFISADWTSEEIAKENNDLNKGYFENNSYKEYPSYYKFSEALKHILKLETKRPLTLLDVGCGSAWLGVYLDKEGFLKDISYCGVDISKHMCKYAEKNVPSGIFFVANIVENPVSNKYDIISASGVIELISDWKMALINMANSTHRWIILHRIFLSDITKTEQVTTYMNLPDIRNHININEIIELLPDFYIFNSDTWEKNSSYTHGTLIFRRKNDA